MRVHLCILPFVICWDSLYGPLEHHEHKKPEKHEESNQQQEEGGGGGQQGGGPDAQRQPGHEALKHLQRRRGQVLGEGVLGELCPQGGRTPPGKKQLSSSLFYAWLQAKKTTKQNTKLSNIYDNNTNFDQFSMVRWRY